MKFSRRWLEHMLEQATGGTDATAVSLEFLLERLTLAGLEVDGVEHEALDEAIVVGMITEARQHPDADRLRVCTVDIGQEPLEIVCGAPNARAGIHVAVATIGAKLPGGLKIKKSKLRGVVSHGMLCSGKELGLGDDHDGIIELPVADIGLPLAELLGLPDDVIDVDLTPNRGDCFSLLGVARETAVFTGRHLPQPVVAPVSVQIKDDFKARVDAPAGAPVFSYRVVRGLDSKAATPTWMVERLRRSGVRAIHPVVDITNYVMLEFGQPMHAYDLDKLSGDIVVRQGQGKESCTLLDGKTVETDDDTLLITDQSGPIGLAGIMGGESTSVTTETTNIVFEAAFFAPAAMAGVARRYAMHTDASLRFERGVDPTQQARAQERAAALLLEIAGGQAAELVVLGTAAAAADGIELRADRLTHVLGTAIEAATVGDIFERLGFAVAEVEAGWRITPPAHRFDIAIEEDLIEEVARVYGYDNLPVARAIAEVALAPHREVAFYDDRARDTLAGRGFQEVITYSFVDPELHDAIGAAPAGPRLLNPISSEMAVMRGSLLPGLLATVRYNTARQQTDLRLFEIGTVFAEDSENQHLAMAIVGRRWPEQWSDTGNPVDLFDLKGDVEAVLGAAGAGVQVSFEAAAHPTLHPGQTAAIVCDGVIVGHLGAIHPGLAIAEDIGKSCVVGEIALDRLPGTLAQATPVNRFPSVRRDLAVIVGVDVPIGALEATVRVAAGAALEALIVFDIYRGKGVEPGLKSVAFGLILQDSSRTLTDESVAAIMATVAAELDSGHGAKLRE